MTGPSRRNGRKVVLLTTTVITCAILTLGSLGTAAAVYADRAVRAHNNLSAHAGGQVRLDAMTVRLDEIVASMNFTLGELSGKLSVLTGVLERLERRWPSPP